MKYIPKTMILTFAFALFPFAGAYAQDSDDRRDDAPQPPRITTGDPTGVKRQAGIGGQLAYAAAGVVELGGLISVTTADDLTEFTATPTVGYFFADNLQISALATWHYTEVEGKQTSNVGTFIIEPSIHLPMTDTTFLFAGLGAGGLFEKEEKPGFAIAPRIGYKNLVGRSGMLTLSLQSVFGMNESEVQTAKGTVLTVENAFNASLGYTVLL